MKFLRALTAGFLTALLLACGGGGGSPGTNSLASGGGGGGASTNTTTTTTTATTPASALPATVEILSDAASVGSGGGASVGFTAIVKDANNLTMVGQTVTFSATSGNLSVIGGNVTNGAGVVIASLGIGGDKSLRDITVTAVAGTASAALKIPVVGTKVAIGGDLSMKLGTAIQYAVKLTDSSGAPVAGRSLTLQSALGNPVSNAGVGTSDFNGVFSFTYTANIAGTDTLTATGLGAVATIRPNISAIDFLVVSPAADTTISVGASQTVTVRYRVGLSGQAGQTVGFSLTRGTLSAQSSLTNASGEATVTISSSSSGPALLVANIAGLGQVTLPVQFVATNPFSLALQASPGAVAPNPAGSTANQSAIQALVLDANGNAVANRQVDFSLVSDRSGGSLSQPSAVTDVNGRASVQFIPGANTTSANGVQLRASVSGTAVSGTSQLTVNGESLFITVGFGNEMSNEDLTTYIRQFSVYVTDANGIAVANKDVTLRVVPTTYGKGRLAYFDSTPATSVTAAIPAGWGYSSRTLCPNEDRNLNGSIDPGEDINNSGSLQPGIPVFTRPGIVRTNSSGLATFNLLYGEQFALWLDIRIEARATVGGTESIYSLPHSLQALASDLANSTISPANSRSPFGTVASCTDPN